MISDNLYEPAMTPAYTSPLEFIRRISLDRAMGRPNRFSSDTDEPERPATEAKKMPVKLGTLAGVFFPSMQNVFGIIFFIRLSWIVGIAGVGMGLLVVGICCLTTGLVSLSMSAIATNGAVPAGGAYFMISRSLGPAFGGAVGILFYLGVSVASSMYVLGAVEVIQANVNFIGPGTITNSCTVISEKCLGLGVDMVLGNQTGIKMVGFEGVDWPQECCSQSLNEMRILGTVLAMLMTSLVFVGMKVVSAVAPVFLAVVIVSILSIYIGFFSASARGSLAIGETGTFITGLSSSTLVDNWGPQFTDKWFFGTLIALFFPSVTGVEAGSNRSGDLANAQQSIPVGTLGAWFVTSAVYFSSVVLWGAVASRETLLNEAGVSVIASTLSWPTAVMVAVGIVLSSIGAGLQSMAGAPRVLQAVARDNIMPFLKPFAGKEGAEPRAAIILTWLISNSCILIGKIEGVTPILTMFFLEYYAFVNLACFLMIILKAPNFRPRWKFYHWTLSLAGFILCVYIMFIISPLYACGAILISVCVFFYIRRYGEEKNWGDAIRGGKFHLARNAILSLRSEGEFHTKNWRPQVLVVGRLMPDHTPHRLDLLAFANQMKKGYGLTLFSSVMAGDLLELAEDARVAEKHLMNVFHEGAVKAGPDGQEYRFAKKGTMSAFPFVLVSETVIEGMQAVIQSAGTGQLVPNTLIAGWPESWEHGRDDVAAGCKDTAKLFVRLQRLAYAQKMAFMVLKGDFPDDSKRLTSNIDVWWLTHDGGLLLLLPYLLQLHKVWKGCNVRVFTICDNEQKIGLLKSSLEDLLTQLRLPGSVKVIVAEGSELEHVNTNKLASSARADVQAASGVKTKPAGADGKEKYHMKGSTAKMMNAYVKKEAKEGNSDLVLLNLPIVKEDSDTYEYMAAVQTLTDGLPPTLMVYGNGSEVITIYS